MKRNIWGKCLFYLAFTQVHLQVCFISRKKTSTILKFILRREWLILFSDPLFLNSYQSFCTICPMSYFFLLGAFVWECGLWVLSPPPPPIVHLKWWNFVGKCRHLLQEVNGRKKENAEKIFTYFEKFASFWMFEQWGFTNGINFLGQLLNEPPISIGIWWGKEL